MSIVRSIRNYLAPRVASWRRHRQNRKYWDSQWSQADFAAPWLRRGISREIAGSLEDGWFPWTGSVLDVGCGEGEVASYFAEKGYRTVGIDISAAAIQRACSNFSGQERLHFRVHDACAAPPPNGPFDILIDRGCFHQIPAQDHAGYRRNLAAVSTANTKLLLFLKAFREGQAFGDEAETSRSVEYVRLGFAHEFEIERYQPTFLDPFEGREPDRALPGLVLWMRRTQNDSSAGQPSIEKPRDDSVSSTQRPGAVDV